MPKGYYNFNFLLDVRKAIFNFVFLATNMILAKNYLFMLLKLETRLKKFKIANYLQLP